MDAVGYSDLMTNDATDTRNATVTQIATHMRPPPRSIVHKHCLLSDLSNCVGIEEARVLWVNTTTAAAAAAAGLAAASGLDASAHRRSTRRHGGGGDGDGSGATPVVVLADPVVAPSTLANDIDPAATVAAVLKSARKRKYFWVFLDHQMTVVGLEKTLDLLTAANEAADASNPKIELVTIDELLRVFHRDNTQ